MKAQESSVHVVTSNARSLLVRVALGLLLLLGAIVSSACPDGSQFGTSGDPDSDPDRPPIIISSGSPVQLEAGWGSWASTSSDNKKFDQDVSTSKNKGKGVTRLSATALLGPGEPCTISGDTLYIEYRALDGSTVKEFTLGKKQADPKAIPLTEVQFLSPATQSGNALVLDDSSELLTVYNSKGTGRKGCSATYQHRITVIQNSR